MPKSLFAGWFSPLCATGAASADDGPRPSPPSGFARLPRGQDDPTQPQLWTCIDDLTADEAVNYGENV